MGRIIIVGTGFSGSILARKIAEELNREVELVEKRAHVAGNMYDEYDEYGILIQRYGPHFLNTNNYWIIEFLEKYSELIPHDAKLLSFIDGKYVQLPFNFRTLQQLVGAKKSETLLSKMRKKFAGRDRVPIFDLMESDDVDIKNYGTLLFEKAYKTYTAKQWGLNPSDIDKSVLNRVPMAMNYDSRYLNKDFQYLPKRGFTNLFKNMLNHKNIHIQLNTDALKHIKFDDKKKSIYYDGEEIELLIFTGAIDELFNFKYGALPYRSLDIRYQYEKKSSILPEEIISYPQAIGYTRSTEYKKMTYGMNPETKISVIATEYPLPYDPNSKIGNTPYYPIIADKNMKIYEHYFSEINEYSNIVLCGRLAEYKYYNMDVCIEHAFDKFQEIKKRLLRS